MMSNETSMKAASRYLSDKAWERKERTDFWLFVAAIAFVVGMLALFAHDVAHADDNPPSYNSVPEFLTVETPKLKCFSTVQEQMDYLFPDDAGTKWDVLAVVKHTKRRADMIVKPRTFIGYDLFKVTLRRGCPQAVEVYNYGWTGWQLLAD